jgi:hypothetical protein
MLMMMMMMMMMLTMSFRMGARCLWDADTDSVVHELFMNDAIFCAVAAFGVYYY